MRSKAEVMAELETMLRDVLVASVAGTTHARVARAHGYVDGYMRALLELGVASRDELLKLVSRERERAGGPALRVIEADSESEAGTDAAAASAVA
jgi:hypothetical protein